MWERSWQGKQGSHGYLFARSRAVCRAKPHVSYLPLTTPEVIVNTQFLDLYCFGCIDNVLAANRTSGCRNPLHEYDEPDIAYAEQLDQYHIPTGYITVSSGERQSSCLKTSAKSWYTTGCRCPGTAQSTRQVISPSVGCSVLTPIIIN